MRARLQFTTGSIQGRELEVGMSPARIGREEGSEFVIPSPEDTYVSRHHAAVHLEGDQLVIVDQGSTNGTLVNGERIQRAFLNDGDTVQFGKDGPVARVILERSQPQETRLAPDVGGRATVPAPPTPPVREPAPGIGGGGGAPPAQVPSPPLLTDSSRQAGEGTTHYVGRLVSSAVGKHEARSKRLTTAVAVIGALALLAVIGIVTVAMADGREDRAFERIVEEYEGSVFLVQTGYRFGDVYSNQGFGTGFAVDEHHIITNKHVALPHLYFQSAACLKAYAESVLGAEGVQQVLTVFRGGTQFRQSVDDNEGDLRLGLTTDDGTLELVRTAEDVFAAPRAITCRGLRPEPFQIQWSEHVQDSNDLALLRTSATLKPLRMASDEPDPNDAILVFGFPRGLLPMETTEADPFRMRGTVVRVQETIQIDAVVLPGNSGGPLINVDGEVVGITSRGIGNVLNFAIKVEWARRLLLLLGRGG